MKNGRTSIIIVLIIIIFAGIIGYVIYANGGFTPSQGKQDTTYEKNDLFFVSQSANGYGVSKSDGTVILESIYKKLIRNNNSVYLTDGTDSYIFFLDTGKSVSLGGKEASVELAYDSEDGKLLPYFILVYGTNNSAIYRIYTSEGVRYENRDFSSLDAAKQNINAQTTFTATKASTAITTEYDIKSTLSYATAQGRTQFIVSKKTMDKETKNVNYGIIDETGRIILDTACTSITELSGETDGVIVKRNNKTYMFLKNEKLLEVDSDFEFISGNGFIVQKVGTTTNKIYNSNGEVVIDGIYEYPTNFISINSATGVSYLFVNEGSMYSMYNVTANKKSETSYTEIYTDYMESYKDKNVQNTSFIYTENKITYCVDLNSAKSYKMNITNTIYSPLDIGFEYIFATK